jgi:hypothetical protein
MFGRNTYAYIPKKVWKSKQSCTTTTIYLRPTDSMKRHKLYNLKRKVVFVVHLMLFNNESFSLTSLK